MMDQSAVSVGGVDFIYCVPEHHGPETKISLKETLFSKDKKDRPPGKNDFLLVRKFCVGDWWGGGGGWFSRLLEMQLGFGQVSEPRSCSGGGLRTPHLASLLWRGMCSAVVDAGSNLQPSQNTTPGNV